MTDTNGNRLNRIENDLETVKDILMSSSCDAQDITPALRRYKANSCGFVKLTDTPTWPTSKLGSFYYYLGSNPSSTYDQGSLPVQPPELCRSGMLYKPSSP